MTTTSVLLRDMRPAEREEVRDLVRAAFLPYADAFPHGLFDLYLTGLLELEAGGRPTTLVAVDAGRCLRPARPGSPRTPERDLDRGVHFGLPDDDLRIVAYAKEPAA